MLNRIAPVHANMNTIKTTWFTEVQIIAHDQVTFIIPCMSEPSPCIVKFPYGNYATDVTIFGSLTNQKTNSKDNDFKHTSHKSL